jgi:hypothetical protein
VGCKVDISVEINARLPKEFDEATIRTVSENSRALKFEHFEFGKDFGTDYLISRELIMASN